MSSKPNKQKPFNNAFGFKVNEEDVNYYIERKRSKKVNEIYDLSELETRTESELIKTLSYMIQNKKFFKYCASLLLNINPGPNYISEYLNLELWIKQTESIPEEQWPPHLYSLMHYVHQTMIKEKQDQVVNLLGQIGSGKTFCIIHIIEFFCCMIGPKTQQVEVFDVIHKSIQLVHMVGSIFRENNIESSSCGMLFRLGFGDDDFITTFDIEAKILDYTLPFSENGRSFSILHGFMTGASSELKRKFNLPEKEHNLNFFRKFHKTFSDKTKERFKLNDLEIWNRFHSLLNQFNFTKDEVIEILQILSFILNLNEVNISKSKEGKLSNAEKYKMNSGITSKKLSKALKIDEKVFIASTGIFSTPEEAKLFIIALIKYSYHMIFEFILKKVKLHLKDFFKNYSLNANNEAFNTTKGVKTTTNNYNTDNGQPFPQVNSRMKRTENVRYINFIDFPGEVDDQTLGGFTTNVSNECLNMISATSYLSIIEKLIKESVILNQFKPLQSYSVIQSSFGDKGIFDCLSNPLTEDNFNKFKEATKYKKHLSNCILFNQGATSKSHECQFSFAFSHKIIEYNYQTLYNEAKSFSFGKKIYNIFSKTNNSVVTSTYQSVINIDKDFNALFSGHLMKLLEPIESIKPFVIYNLHSNASYKIFFNKDDQIFNESDLIPEIPNDLTIKMLKHSLAFPVLNWNWYGYKEWMEYDTIIKEYTNDLEKAKSIIASSKKIDHSSEEENIKLDKLSPVEKIKYTMNILSREGDYIIGKNYVIMKKNTLARMRSSLNSMIKLAKDIIIKKKKEKEKEKDKHSSIKIKNKLSNSSLHKQESNKRLLSQGRNKKGYSSQLYSNIKNSLNKIPIISDIQLQDKDNEEFEDVVLEEKQFKLVNEDASRQYLLKEQCIMNIIEDNHIINNTKPTTVIKCDTYNVFSFIDKARRDLNKKENKNSDNNNLNANTISQDITIDNSRINTSIIKNQQSISNTVLSSNIVLPQRQQFMIIKNSLDPKKNKNFNIFDYNDSTLQVILIQKNFRALYGRKQLKRMQFIYSRIVKIQSYIRGSISRLKLQRFINCLRKVLLIQKIYRERLKNVHQSAISIQAFYKGYRRRMKTKFRLIEQKKAVSKGEIYIYMSTEEEEIANRRTALFNKISSKTKANAICSNINNNENTNFNKKKSKSKSAIRHKKIESIENETNQNTLIKALLFDKKLLNENNDFNQLVIQSKGVDPILRDQITTRLYHNNNKISSNNDSIVDRLMNDYSALKKKRQQEQLEKYKEEEKNLTFKPNIHPNKYSKKTADGPDFLKRNELYQQLKERNIENIRNKYKMEEENFTYKPKINNDSSSVQRDFKRLYNLKQIRNKYDRITNRISPDDSGATEEIYINPNKEIERNKKAINYYDKYDLYTKENDEIENIDMTDLWPQKFDKEFIQFIRPLN